jgi:hypothetical protein
MMSLRLNDLGTTNRKPPGANRGATVTEPSGSLGLREGAENTSFSHSPDRRVNGAVPAMTHAYALARELAKPVARGHLTLTEAHASLLATALQASRTGQLGGYDPGDTFRGLRHVLGLHLEAEQRRRALTEGRIARRLRPLIALRKPSNVLFAEAHDVNGLDGFPFEEPEVNDIAKTAMFWSLPAQGNSHGR